PPADRLRRRAPDEPRAARSGWSGAGKPAGGDARDEQGREHRAAVFTADGSEPPPSDLSSRRSGRRRSPSVGAGMKRSRPIVVALLLALAASATAVTSTDVAVAAEEPDAFVRIVVDSAELRSGPSISSRVIYTAHRGETFAVDGRQGTGFWLRVVLPDGRTAYALGDEMVVFAVRPGEPEAPSRPGFFATPPLEGTVAGFAILGGVLAIPTRDNTTRAF